MRNLRRNRETDRFVGIDADAMLERLARDVSLMPQQNDAAWETRIRAMDNAAFLGLLRDLVIRAVKVVRP